MKPKVAFVCTHNSCRSQIAEALGRKYASDVFESYSAGTEIRDSLNPDAVRLMKEIYGIDMVGDGQHNKLLSELPKVSWVITMGCGVQCPAMAAKHHEDWGLEDPTGKSDDVFRKTISEIEARILNLRERILLEKEEH